MKISCGCPSPYDRYPVANMNHHSDPPPAEERSKNKTNPESSQGGHETVALLAIHGVGQHPYGASADAVSTLLLSIGRNGGPEAELGAVAIPPYSGFVTTSLDVPLRPVQSAPEEAQQANERPSGSPLSKLWNLFDERRGFIANLRKDADYRPHGYTRRQLRPGEPDRGEYGYQFMLTQIAGYKGKPDRNFETVRLEGTRTVDASETNVHIYDAHYSDLTKPQNSIIGFFFAFYQLLIHLASLSLLAVYWVEAENVQADKLRIWRWRVESTVHAASVRLLIMWIPILNLVLLEIACSAFIDKVPSPGWMRVLGFGLAALFGLAATFVLAWAKLVATGRPFFWAMLPLLGAGLGVLILDGSAFAYRRAFSIHLDTSELVLLLSWLLAAGVLHAWIGKLFDPLRPGAFALAIVLYLVNAALFLFCLLPLAAGERAPMATASLWMVQTIFGELWLAWVLCLLFAFVSWPLSAFCKSGIKSGQAKKDEHEAKEAGHRKARAIAAFRTGRFAFAVPALLFVIVTCALWSGVVVGGSDKLKAFEGVDTSVETRSPTSKWPFSEFIPRIGAVEDWVKIGEGPSAPGQLKPDNSDYWSKYLRGLLLVSVTPGLPITMGLLGLGLLALTWAVLPSLIFELSPERVTSAKARTIRWLGEWLSHGLDNTAILTRMLWFAIVPVPLLFLGLDWAYVHELTWRQWRTFIESTSKVTLPLIKWEGLALAVAGAAVFGVILKYLTTLLDTILDVDNYLRTYPQEGTPRARIVERCTSLLRYIAAYRNPQTGLPYAKVIIVAHSLGSIVTTDLLRYLERSAEDCSDSDLASYGFRKRGGRQIPIYVFSMGCPLRQLLNRFFPHLYWWVSDVPDNSLTALSDSPSGSIGSIRIPSLPRADEMNVTYWANAYRSGDYVGRSLWVGTWWQRNRSDDLTAKPSIACAGAPQSCEESCIGSGAHTHYWDRTAPEVANVLDRLISLTYP